MSGEMRCGMRRELYHTSTQIKEENNALLYADS